MRPRETLIHVHPYTIRTDTLNCAAPSTLAALPCSVEAYKPPTREFLRCETCQYMAIMYVNKVARILQQVGCRRRAILAVNAARVWFCPPCFFSFFFVEQVSACLFPSLLPL